MTNKDGEPLKGNKKDNFDLDTDEEFVEIFENISWKVVYMFLFPIWFGSTFHQL